MGKDEKKILVSGVALLIAWIAIFYFLVYPMWTQRDETVGEAQKKLEKLAKLTKGAKGTWDITKADESLDNEAAALQVMLTELKAVEAGNLGIYSISKVDKGDPATYFSQMRVELIEKIAADPLVLLAPAIEKDLAFKDKANSDPVALNLVRLHVLDRFFAAAKLAGVREVMAIQYPDAIPMPRPEGLEIESLVQVPIVVQLRLPEASLGPLLYQLEPNPKNGAADRYFCIRALQVNVKDDKTGLLDAVINLGALYTHAQMKEQGVTVKEERPSLGTFNRGLGDSTRY
jgi:hypothetical protein